jgi:hypothetical protein
VHSLFITPPIQGTFSYLFDVFMLKIFCWDAGTLAYKDLGGSNATIPVTTIPGRAYILTCERRPATQDYNGNGVISGHEFVFRLEDLVTDVVVSHTLEQGNNHPGVEKVWRLGHSSTNFSHVQGPFVIHNGNDATDMATCQEWLRKKYLGTAVSEESENGSGEDAAFFLELDIATS